MYKIIDSWNGLIGFAVALAGPTSSSGGNATVVEGETLELIAVFEFNLILDSITWERDGTSLQNGSEGVTITNSDLNPPNATSTLRQRDIRRSSDGVSYTVTATNSAGSTTATFNLDVFCKKTLYYMYLSLLPFLIHLCSFAFLCLWPPDPPEVRVSATRTRLPVNESTTLTCSVTSSNPSGDFSVVWTLTNTTGVTSTLTNTDLTLELSGLGLEQFGTYTCNVTNSEGLSGEANITIEEGG